MHAAHHRHRTFLPELLVAAHDEVAVLALRAHHGGDALVMHLHPVGAVVYPASIRVAHDHHIAGADVVAPVVLVPLRRRNLEQIDVVATCDVLQHETAGHRD